ncbi:hypothetical protein [Bosea lathyri]|uniref:Uncharacterized protein n=1 Tax=Bosea lathyri TaxID=1036778 RepID=A0A1H6BKR4_9HYPH|nr:hypothetical protein [Bosea lathyri]SEG61254.1 hypothetical protein SAMN04488115_107321 [Bosea lathyri]
MSQPDANPQNVRAHPGHAPIVAAMGRCPAFEKALADAYRKLEYSIPNLRYASILLETMRDDALENPDMVAGNDDLRRFDLTKDQWDGLIYAISHVGDLARDLDRLYFAGFEQGQHASRQQVAS